MLNGKQQLWMDDPLFEQRKRNFRTYDNMIKYYNRNAKKLTSIILLQCINMT